MNERCSTEVSKSQKQSLRRRRYRPDIHHKSRAFALALTSVDFFHRCVTDWTRYFVPFAALWCRLAPFKRQRKLVFKWIVATSCSTLVFLYASWISNGRLQMAKPKCVLLLEKQKNAVMPQGTKWAQVFSFLTHRLSTIIQQLCSYK